MIGFTTEDECIDSCLHEAKQRSILELFPEYDFKIAEEEVKKYKIILIFFVIIPVLWSALIVFCVTGLFSRLKKIYTFNPKIVYIQNTIWWIKPYSFIVDENRNWGLIDSSLKIRITPQYDFMKWKKKGKLIEAKSGERTVLIDVNNNLCI